MSYCIKCGKELHNEADFCFHCGASVPKGEVSSSDSDVKNSEAYAAPMLQQIPFKDQGVTKSKKKKIVLCVVILLPVLIVGTLLAMLFGYFLGPRTYDAKIEAREEVEAAWQEFDENMELLSVTYDSVDIDEWDHDEIEKYIDKYGDIAITDLNGKKYDTHWEYWDAKGYDPRKETYRIFTIKGDYHVTDHRNQDYEGWYCVKVLHRVKENSWRIEETELEMPDELKQYL